MIQLPPKAVFWSTLKISILAWIVLRGFAGASAGSLSIYLPASVFLILGVGVVALLDSYVARERLFLANLGVGRRWVGVFAVSVALVLEVIAALALRVAG